MAAAFPNEDLGLAGVTGKLGMNLAKVKRRGACEDAG